MTVEERVMILEKEIADLKRQLGERPINKMFHPCDALMEVKQKSEC